MLTRTAQTAIILKMSTAVTKHTENQNQDNKYQARFQFAINKSLKVYSVKYAKRSK